MSGFHRLFAARWRSKKMMGVYMVLSYRTPAVAEGSKRIEREKITSEAKATHTTDNCGNVY